MSNKELNFAAVQHTPDTIFAYPVNSNTLRIRIKTARGNCVKASIRYKNVYEHEFAPAKKDMVIIATDRYHDYFEVEITEPGKRFKYYFELMDLSNNIWIFSYGKFTPYKEVYTEYFFYPYLFEEDITFSPYWASEGFIYQIFVDRFYNGDKTNDPQKSQSWGTIPSSKSFYGGDLKGISEKLDYISSLGVTIIYLTPIFLSDTNHKYDTIDYYKIDPAFGTVEQMQELVDKAHYLGIRIVLDAVFNHCSNQNALFLDVVEKGEESEYYNWFSIDGARVETSPINYDSFGNLVPEMPRLNSSNPLVQDYCIEVAIYWTKLLRIDGWRLDVADEISHVFWKRFRKKLRNTNPEIYILGEAWNRATPWLLGDEFDSATNYKFRNALISLVSEETCTGNDFWDEISHNEMNYKTTTLPFLVNLISSHDCMRILTEFNGNKAPMYPMFGILMTYQGIPLLYYGDEIGLEGGEDPDNRRTMIWDEAKQDKELLNFISKLGALRKSSDVLRHGTIKRIKNLPDKVIGFNRAIKDDKFFVLANFSKKKSTIFINASDANGLNLKSCLDNRSFSVNSFDQHEILLIEYDFLILRYN